MRRLADLWRGSLQGKLALIACAAGVVLLAVGLLTPIPKTHELRTVSGTLDRIEATRNAGGASIYKLQVLTGPGRSLTVEVPTGDIAAAALDGVRGQSITLLIASEQEVFSIRTGGRAILPYGVGYERRAWPLRWLMIGGGVLLAAGLAILWRLRRRT